MVKVVAVDITKIRYTQETWKVLSPEEKIKHIVAKYKVWNNLDPIQKEKKFQTYAKIKIDTFYHLTNELISGHMSHAAWNSKNRCYESPFLELYDETWEITHKIMFDLPRSAILMNLLHEQIQKLKTYENNKHIKMAIKYMEIFGDIFGHADYHQIPYKLLEIMPLGVVAFDKREDYDYAYSLYISSFFSPERIPNL